MRRRWFALFGVATLLAVAGGSCRSQPPTVPAPAPTAGIPNRPPPESDDVRNNALPVPAGAKPHDLGFIDADTGYVLFTHCLGGCQGSLYVTFDGGRSWLRRTLPAVDRAELLQVTMLDARTVVFSAQPSGWYRSTDGGRTFVRGGDGAPDAAAVGRGVTTGCPSAQHCPGVVMIDGAPAPTQPALPGQLRTAARATRAGTAPIWAVSANGTTLFTARSLDSGRTWQSFGGPLVVADAGAIDLEVSTDGADAWLITGPGTGHVAVYVAEASWQQVTGKLILGINRASAAAAGNGVLALGGDDFGYLRRDGRWELQATPRLVPRVAALADGALFVGLAPDDAWLGTGDGADRTWAHVTVDAAS